MEILVRAGDSFGGKSAPVRYRARRGTYMAFQSRRAVRAGWEVSPYTARERCEETPCASR